MLPQKNRLSKKEEWREVFSLGKSFFSGPILVKIRKNNKDHSRFGFSVGVKISPKASQRNYIKRILRAFVFSQLDKIASGYDVLVICKKNENIKQKLVTDLKNCLELAKNNIKLKK